MSMTTRDNTEHRAASIRGVSFYVDAIGGTGGRRALPHAYPKKERGWTEDNGAVSGKQKIEGFCLGEDFLGQLSRLLEALNQPGPCELVHPWWGRQRVQVGEVTHRLTTKTGGYATVTFEVYEAGESLFPASTASSQDALLSSASASQEATIDDFEAQFDSDNLPGFGQESLLDKLSHYNDALMQAVLALPDLPDALGDWLDALDALKYNLGTLLAYPGELARQVTNLFYDVQELVNTPPQALEVYSTLQSRLEGMQVNQSNGHSQTQKNQMLIDNLYMNTLVAGQAVSLSQSLSAMVTSQDYDASWSDASSAATRAQQIKSSLETCAYTSLDNQMPKSWRALRDVRIRLGRDIDERVLMLPRVRTVQSELTKPVALLAYQETGSTESRDSIVKRNRLRHPSFITPDMQIEIVEVSHV